MIPRDNQFDIEFLKRKIKEIERDSVLCGYKGSIDMDWSNLFPNYPPADRICFSLAKVAEEERSKRESQ